MDTQPITAIRRRRQALGQLVPTSLPKPAAELLELLDRKAIGRPVRRGQEIVSEGRPCTVLFLILEGLAMRFRILRDGQRQVLNVLVPGDFAGAMNCRFEKALYSVKTLTPLVVAALPVQTLSSLVESNPRLGAELLWGFSSQAAIMAEHLIVVGRRSAPERIAHLLLELLVRLQSVGLADRNSYLLPLTQEMIGDSLGLSVPYVNRLLQQFREEGLVRVQDRVVTIDNIAALAAIADFEHGYLTPMSTAAAARTAAADQLAAPWNIRNQRRDGLPLN